MPIGLRLTNCVVDPSTHEFTGLHCGNEVVEVLHRQVREVVDISGGSSEPYDHNSIVQVNLTVRNCSAAWRIYQSEGNLEQWAGMNYQTPKFPNFQIDPFMLEYHSTRYGAGCWTWLDEEHHHSSFNFSVIHPFLFNFDYLVTFCGVEWTKPYEVGDRSPCLFRVPRQQANITQVFKDDGFTRIHVQGDRFNIEYFSTKAIGQFPPTEKLIVHIGTADRDMNAAEGKFLIEEPKIVRLVVENCRYPLVANSSKTILQPIGICTRENHAGVLGGELRESLKVVADEERSRLLSTTRQQQRLLREIAQNASHTRWADRSSDVLSLFRRVRVPFLA